MYFLLYCRKQIVKTNKKKETNMEKENGENI